MYSPRIKPELIPELYKISKEVKQPMTKVVDSMIRQGIQYWQKEGKKYESSYSTKT